MNKKKPMDKRKKVMLVLKIAVVLDIITTYIFLTYFTGLEESNPIIQILYNYEPLWIFAYIPFILVLFDSILDACYKKELEVEGRALVLMGAFTFGFSALTNIVFMIAMI